MTLYKKITTIEKAEQLSANVDLVPYDIDAVWEAMVEDEWKVLLSKDYGESFTVREKNTDGVRVIKRIGENTKFQHWYSLVE